jgi:hypothetical protein
MSQVELFLNSLSPNNRIVAEAYLQTTKPVDNYRSPFTGELLYGIDQLICRIQAITKYCDEGIASALSKQKEQEEEEEEEEEQEEEEPSDSEESLEDAVSDCSSKYAEKLDYDISDVLIALIDSGKVNSSESFAEFGITCFEELAIEVIPPSHQGRFDSIENEVHRNFAWTLHCMATFHQTFFAKLSQRARVEFLDEFYGFICNYIQPDFYRSNPADLKFISNSAERVYQQAHDMIASNALVQNKDDSYADDELIQDLIGCLADTLEAIDGVRKEILLTELYNIN